MTTTHAPTAQQGPSTADGYLALAAQLQAETNAYHQATQRLRTGKS